MTSSPVQVELEEAEVERLLDKVSVPSGFVEEGVEFVDGKVVLEGWQKYIVDTNDPRVILNKARQTGFSFAVACRGFARCYLSPANGYTLALTSFNLEDAFEKIRYINQLDDGLPSGERLKRIVDSKTSIEYENGNRVVSMFTPRGKHAEVVIDEMAIMQDPRRVYQAAVGMTARGGGIIVGSSPLSQAGQFADIWKAEGGKFLNFKRIAVPFWKSAALCLDIVAATNAYDTGVPLEEIVYGYGRETIIEAFDSMFDEDFRTEFCCQWIDGSSAFLSWELVDTCSNADRIVKRVTMNRNEGFARVQELVEGLRSIEGDIYTGFDVGRRKDKSEIMLGALRDGKVGEVAHITLDRTEFEVQERVTDLILSLDRARIVCIDETGLGMELAERGAKRHGSRVQGVTMSVKTKPQIANNLRVMMETSKVEFGRDRETMIQLHSVKRQVRPGSNTVTYDVDRNEKHHADRFIAAGLMCWGAADKLQGTEPAVYVFDFADEAREMQASRLDEMILNEEI